MAPGRPRAVTAAQRSTAQHALQCPPLAVCTVCVRAQCLCPFALTMCTYCALSTRRPLIFRDIQCCILGTRVSRLSTTLQRPLRDARHMALASLASERIARERHAQAEAGQVRGHSPRPTETHQRRCGGGRRSPARGPDGRVGPKSSSISAISIPPPAEVLKLQSLATCG